MYDSLNFQKTLDRLDLISPSIADLLLHWHGPTTEGANCVIVESTRGEMSTTAACLAPVDSRIDFNGIVRKTLNGRRVSLAPLEKTLKDTSMEYGSVTPVGLPFGWPILIDEKILSVPRIIIGAGLVRAKLSIPSKALLELPGAIAIKNLTISR